MKKTIILIFFLCSGVIAAQEHRVIHSSDARNNVGQIVIVEYETHKTGTFKDDGCKEVYSTPEWHYPSSFILRFPPEVQAQGAKLGVDSVSNHYNRRHLRVSGKLEWTPYSKNGKHFPCILIKDLAQIDIFTPEEYSHKKSEFRLKEIGGFKVYYSPAFSSKGGDKTALAVQNLEKALSEVASALPDESQIHMGKAPIFCFFKSSSAHRMTYHPHKDFIDSHDMPPFLHRAIEIHELKTLADDTVTALASTLCHEFAHVYHDHALSSLDEDISDAYKSAYKAGLYDPYEDQGGRLVHRYARTNDGEYFAELSRCYFFGLSYPPYTKAELADLDPKGFRLVESAWNLKPTLIQE